ncbi:MAG: hypothetical protein HHAS10_08330 [Candidatus Altimarinota bacterium]
MYLKGIFAVARFFLRLRYRVRIEGMKEFDHPGPIIVFPNHPALVDPMIMITEIGRKKILSPVMTETYINTPGLGPILHAMKTVPVGDLARGGNIDDVEKAFEGIRKGIENKQNILIYPSGHIYVQPFEHIVGKKMAFEIVSRLPDDAKIIVARTKGLWGSIWGKAYTGESPKLMKVLTKSLWYIFSNGIFFVPKREVTIEYKDMTEQLRMWKKEGLDAFNQNLQDYYNHSGNEECRFIKHYFYHNDVLGKKEPEAIAGSIAELEKKTEVNIDIPAETLKDIRKKVATIKKIDLKDIKDESNLVLELHCDSLDMAEIKSVIQKDYPNSSNPPIGLLKTPKDLAYMSLGVSLGEEKLPRCTFQPRTETNIVYKYSEGDTILSEAKKVFKSEKNSPFLYDAILGEMTRDEFLLRSYVISTYLSRIKDDRIGIMIPALSSTSLLLFGVYLSGKLPVMLNWTVGEKSFAHCMNFAGLEVILTSKKFYEKIQSPWLAAFEGKMVFIEDIIKDLSFSMKGIAVIKKFFFLLPKKREDAVMLFTSGSESLPKAILLTHKNILCDIEGALALVPFKKNETIIGFLPPFHSFGFTINTIFPFVAPVQAAYTPDPGDARTIGKILLHTQASIVSATPTFLRMILSGNEAHSLTSLKFAFVGAEKCNDEVFSLFRKKCPEAIILEGYGITECSPIVTVNPLSKQLKGSAGKFLPTIIPMIRSLDNKESLKAGEQGMIYITGPSIFGGYIDPNLESPFDEFDGKKWYKTGDLGYIDEEGFLFITGRLKRFVKIAGEMISLPFIEGILLEKYGNPEVTTLAIEAKEENGNVTIVAFTNFEESVDVINDYIHTHGASNLVKIARVEKLNAIPILGTGKTDYKQLKSLIQ